MTAQSEAINTVLKGLVERGCSPAEALDYYMTDVGPYTQTAWAEIRRVSQQTVSGNVKQAREKMADA